MKKTISALVVLAGIVVTLFINYSHAGFGGSAYVYLPFPIQQTGCGDTLTAMNSCTYPFISWGIISSIIFWILLIGIAYIINRKPKTDAV